MRLDLDRPLPSVALVTFSRRNLLALLHKLEMPGSARTLTSMDAYVSGVAVSSLMLIIRVEDDEAHYRDRPFPAGPMHPDTEVFIAARELLETLGLLDEPEESEGR